MFLSSFICWPISLLHMIFYMMWSRDDVFSAEKNKQTQLWFQVPQEAVKRQQTLNRSQLV